MLKPPIKVAFLMIWNMDNRKKWDLSKIDHKKGNTLTEIDFNCGIDNWVHVKWSIDGVEYGYLMHKDMLLHKLLWFMDNMGRQA